MLTVERESEKDEFHMPKETLDAVKVVHCPGRAAPSFTKARVPKTPFRNTNAKNTIQESPVQN